MSKLSKYYTYKSRVTLYGHYVKYRLKHHINFEQYIVLHEKQIAKTNKVIYLK